MAAIVATVSGAAASTVETDDYVPSHTRRWTVDQRNASMEYAVAHEVGIDTKLVKHAHSLITSGSSVIFEHSRVRSFRL
jgi:hypothetical protein